MDTVGGHSGGPSWGWWETGEITSGTSVDDPGNVVPMVQVVCRNCGYVMLFAAMPIRLV